MTTIPLNSVFDRMLTLTRAMDDIAAQRSATGGAPALWLPAVDLFETEHAFVIEADLPGLRSDQIELHFEQNTLTIKGERESTLPASEHGRDGHRVREATRIFSVERPSGAFTRSIRLPEYVDGERIEAAYEQGVLRVRVPKASSALPRKIEVKTAQSEKARQINA